MLDLKGRWTLKNNSKNISINCNIPGDNVSALLESELIEDPYYGCNEALVEWIGLEDWQLSREFEIEQQGLKKSHFLYIERLDTIANVFINDVFICKHENMFYPLFMDITSTLKVGLNQIRIVLASPIRYAQGIAKKIGYPIPYSDYARKIPSNRNLIRKVQCHAGWDWGIDLVCSGIYGECQIKTSSTGFIKYSYVDTKKRSTNNWAIDINLEYYSLQNTTLNVDIDFDNKTISVPFKIERGNNNLQYTIEVESPKLWWPVGYGNQALYKLIIKTDEEKIIKKIGIRELEAIYRDDEYGRSFFFRVNGVDVYSKGANWIPVDARPSLQTEKKYKELLTDALLANMNTIRLWGGGQYEKDCFYEICDEKGILIWHDFMFACGLYPSNSGFLENVKREAEHQIKKLKSHPSIALWCGNNENLGAMRIFEESKKNRDRYLIDYDRLNEGILGETVKRLDKHRNWWPSSPSAGPNDYTDCWHDDSKGDMHYWSVWHEGLPFESYYDVIPRFCSEFGFQSFPDIHTVKSFANNSQLNLTSKVMRTHQKNKRGNTIILSTMAEYFRMPEDFESQLFISQVQQAYAIRTAVEYWRSMRPINMGALYWQLNDNWPVASWSSIDYLGRWKLLHYEAARFFKPVNIFAHIKNNKIRVYVVNDLLKKIDGKFKVLLKSFDGKTSRLLKDSEIKLQKQVSIKVWEGELPNAEIREDNFLYFTFKADNETFSNYLLLNRPLDCNFIKPAINISLKNREYLLVTDKPAFYVTAETDQEGRFSDNGILLLPDKPVKIHFIPKSESNNLPAIADINLRWLK